MLSHTHIFPMTMNAATVSKNSQRGRKSVAPGRSGPRAKGDGRQPCGVPRLASPSRAARHRFSPPRRATKSGGWRAASSARLQGKGSHGRGVFSQTPLFRRDPHGVSSMGVSSFMVFPLCNCKGVVPFNFFEKCLIRRPSFRNPPSGSSRLSFFYGLQLIFVSAGVYPAWI